MFAWEEAFTSSLGVFTSPPPVAMAWKDNEAFAVRAANAGLDVVLCPAHFLYLDLVPDLNFEDRGLYWAAPTLPLHRIYGYEPLARLRRLGLQETALKRVKGLQANLWTETVDSEERAQEMSLDLVLGLMKTVSDLKNPGEYRQRG